ncbi:lycopene cyclase domain-containing protein [Microbacterium sp. ZW T5_56]|uniref:lycopene cyclase domain-containing protein n=1 Tax=Microbacterium sp. ZW T5_56 TaxID=3378081 RepID=UPI0038542FF4
MSYAALAGLFLLAALLVAAVLRLVARRSVVPLAVAVTLAVLSVLTAVFDSVMIAARFFHYDPDQLLGVMIGLAPIEDFAYPLAGAILLPALWVLLASRRERTETDTTGVPR